MEKSFDRRDMGGRRDILWTIVVPLLLASLPEGGECRKNSTRGPIQEAIQSGTAAEYNKENCTWRRGNDRDSCPDPDVHIYLHTPGRPKRILGEGQSDWLRQDYEPTRENIVLIHGYAGGDDTLPIAVLRDAYTKNGSYNVFLVDWGALSAPPCYPAAVSNVRPVARCLAATLTTLRHLGMPISRTTCVGHSLGAHLCGVMANYLLFRMHRIVGLDPARPLVRPGLVNRLDSGDADFVQVIHTNAGYYGETGRVGHVDFCVNGGRVQPFCENRPNDQLCSHVWVVCYMAQSVDGGKELLAEPCTRRCPTGPRISSRAGEVLAMGQQTPDHSRGSFCYTGYDPPYCPKYDTEGRGDRRCCLVEINTRTLGVTRNVMTTKEWVIGATADRKRGDPFGPFKYPLRSHSQEASSSSRSVYHWRMSDLESLKFGDRFQESRVLIGVDDFLSSRDSVTSSPLKSLVSRGSRPSPPRLVSYRCTSETTVGANGYRRKRKKKNTCSYNC